MTFTCDSQARFLIRGVYLGSTPEPFRKLKALFADDPSDYARPLEAEIDAALLRWETMMIEEFV